MQEEPINMAEEAEEEPGVFTTLCNNFYYFTQDLYEQRAVLQRLEDNVPTYNGQADANHVDELIDYYSKGYAAKLDYDETYKALLATESRILRIMRDFEIPPHKVFVITIPYEVEYELCRTANDRIIAIKLKDLEPEPENPNVMVIKFSNHPDRIRERIRD